MNQALEALIARIDNDLNQTVLPTTVLLAKGHAARLLAIANQDRLATLVFAAPVESAVDNLSTKDHKDTT